MFLKHVGWSTSYKAAYFPMVNASEILECQTLSELIHHVCLEMVEYATNWQCD